MVEVVVFEYNPEWPRRFEEEKARILTVAASWIVDIQHGGSTSVPGLSAKPIIDILAGLSDIALVASCIEPLRSIGYEHLGENGIPGRHFFRKPGGDSWIERHFNVHMMQLDGSEWNRMTLFRDYLRAHPETARQYAAIKSELAQRFASDREGYVEGKVDFIASIVEKARQTLKDNH